MKFPQWMKRLFQREAASPAASVRKELSLEERFPGGPATYASMMPHNPRGDARPQPDVCRDQQGQVFLPPTLDSTQLPALPSEASGAPFRPEELIEKKPFPEAHS